MRVNKKHTFQVKPIVTLLAVGLFTGKAFAASPFASIPLHLQNSSTTTTAGGVKPNVMLQVDDSTSMDERVTYQGVDQGSRIDVTRLALQRVLANQAFRDKVNWNIITLGDSTNNRYRLQQFLNNQNAKFGIPPQDIEKMLQDYRGVTNTPTTERYLDSLHILRSALDKRSAYRCQKSYVIIFSDGYANGFGRRMEGNANIGWAPTGSIFMDYDSYWFAHNGKYRYRHPNLAKFNGSLLYRQGGTYAWDNDWQRDWYPKSWANDFWESQQYFAETVQQTDLKTGGTDAAGKSWDGEADDPINKGKQTIGTFAIGFGLQAKQLDYASVLTGSKALNANNQQELDAAFQQIFDQIISENQNAPPSAYSSVSPALPSEDTTSGIPNMAASMHLDLQKGSSEIRFYDVSTSSTTNLTTVGTTYKTPDFSNRKVIIGPSATQSATWLNSFAGNNALFDIPATPTNSSEWKDSLIPWLMRQGDDGSANKTGNALQYRVRDAANRQMGDVVNAPILTYGASTYGRQKYLVTAANDGMVYLFQSNNSASHPYTLKLNYLPGYMSRESADDTLVRNLKNLADPKYITDAAKPHMYMVDGGITIRSTDRSGPEQIFMVGNLGRGGRGTYAINLGGHKRSNASQAVGIDAPESNWTTSVPLFETPKGAAADQIGYSIGSPTVGRISPDRSLAANGVMATNLYDVKYAAFVGSGVKSVANPTASESALYVYNIFGGENVGLQVTSGSQPTNSAQSGELLRKISVGNTGGLMEPTIVDANFDGIVDVAYAADYNGGLYRFDLRNGAPNTWTAHKIFQTKDNRPVTSAPAIVRQARNKYIIIFGTGSDLYQADLGNRDTQSVYGIYDDLTVSNPGQVNVSDLLEQTVSLTTVEGKQARTLSDHQIESTHKGWFFDLPAGERVVVKPSILLRTVLLSTRSYHVNTIGNTAPPSNDPCIGASHTAQSKGESWVMQFRSDTGGILPNRDSRDPDRDLFAYVDFFRQNTEGKSSFRLQTMYAGAQLGSALTAVTTAGVSNSSGDNPGGWLSSMTAHGDGNRPAGRDGVLDPNKSRDPNNPNNPNNPNEPSKDEIPDLCFAFNNSKLFVTDSEKGMQAVHNIYGKICGAQLRRISWREIF